LYPTAPAQIPACGTTALGSSEILASVKDKLVLPSLLFPAEIFASFIQSKRSFHPVRNIKPPGALPLKIIELLSWYTFSVYLI